MLSVDHGFLGGAAETGGCIGDPTRKEYGAQGTVGLRKSEFVVITTQPDRPSF